MFYTVTRLPSLEREMCSIEEGLDNMIKVADVYFQQYSIAFDEVDSLKIKEFTILLTATPMISPRMYDFLTINHKEVSAMLSDVTMLMKKIDSNNKSDDYTVIDDNIYKVNWRVMSV